MGAYVYGCVYTILFVLLGKLFMETFGCSCRFENRWIRCCLLVGLMIGMYGVSIFLNGNWIVKEVLVFTFTTLFMWGYFQQGLLRTGAFILLYQGLGFLLDYVTILMLAKCCTTITEERVSEPLVTALMGMLSQLLLLVVIIVHTSAHAAEIDGYADGSGMGTFFGVSFLYRDCIDRAACRFWNTAYESTEEHLTGNLVRTDRDEYSGLLSDQLDFGKGDALARGSGFYGACQK